MRKRLLTALAIAILSSIPRIASTSLVIEAEEQHSRRARCPRNFELVSIDAGDADLLVCVPLSASREEPELDQARPPSHEEDPGKGARSE